MEDGVLFSQGPGGNPNEVPPRGDKTRKEGQEACITCGNFFDAPDLYYADKGMQCTLCYNNEEADGVWNKGLLLQAGLGPGLAIASLYMDPCFLASVFAVFSTINTVRMAFSSKRDNSGFEINKKQKTLLLGSAALAVVFLSLRVVQIL